MPALAGFTAQWVTVGAGDEHHITRYRRQMPQRHPWTSINFPCAAEVLITRRREATAAPAW